MTAVIIINTHKHMVTIFNIQYTTRVFRSLLIGCLASVVLETGTFSGCATSFSSLNQGGVDDCGLDIIAHKTDPQRLLFLQGLGVVQKGLSTRQPPG
jgi:hypothetical protein